MSKSRPDLKKKKMQGEHTTHNPTLSSRMRCSITLLQADEQRLTTDLMHLQISCVVLDQIICKAININHVSVMDSGTQRQRRDRGNKAIKIFVSKVHQIPEFPPGINKVFLFYSKVVVKATFQLQITIPAVTQLLQVNDRYEGTISRASCILLKRKQ